MNGRFLIAVLLTALAGCTTETTPQQTPSFGMANPASENCVRLGGRLQMRSSPAGESGYCHLPDGRVVEEWALYRGTPVDGRRPSPA